MRLILCEGNYLLLDDPAWTPLAVYFDLTVMVEVPLPVIEARLLKRWQGMADGPAKVAENDLPNARIVAERSRPADLVLNGAG